MESSVELVRRAIEFGGPERLPFFQHEYTDIPDDVQDVWEMDRAEAGWFFDNPKPDDWGCIWSATEIKSMGQVTEHPLNDWGALRTYRPPGPEKIHITSAGWERLLPPRKADMSSLQVIST